MGDYWKCTATGKGGGKKGGKNKGYDYNSWGSNSSYYWNGGKGGVQASVDALNQHLESQAWREWEKDEREQRRQKEEDERKDRERAAEERKCEREDMMDKLDKTMEKQLEARC